MRNKAKFNLVYNLIILRIITSFISVLLIFSNQVPPERIMMAEKVMNGVVIVAMKFNKQQDKLNKDD